MVLGRRGEPVLAMLRREWLLCSAYRRVLVLFISFLLIYLSQALIITCVARLFHCSGFVLFIVLKDITHAAFLHRQACKEPHCDSVEAQ
jgi:hypothetical protein